MLFIFIGDVRCYLMLLLAQPAPSWIMALAFLERSSGSNQEWRSGCVGRGHNVVQSESSGVCVCSTTSVAQSDAPINALAVATMIYGSRAFQ